MAELIDRGYIYIAQPPLYKVARGKSEQYLKDERAMEDYLIATGVEDAVLRLASGEERAGVDLRELVEEARVIRNVLDGLHSRYNRKVVEQAAILGVLNAEIFGDPEKAARRRRPTSPSAWTRWKTKPSAAGKANSSRGEGFHVRAHRARRQGGRHHRSRAARLGRCAQARRICRRRCRGVYAKPGDRFAARTRRPSRSTARSVCSRRSPAPAARASRCSATKAWAR